MCIQLTPGFIYCQEIIPYIDIYLSIDDNMSEVIIVTS